MTKLEELWRELEGEARLRLGTGILRRMVAPEGSSTMFVGVKQPSLSRVFILEAPRLSMPSRDQIPESRGFDLAAQITGDERDDEATLILGVIDSAFNEVFSAMAEDICGSLQRCTDAKLKVALMMERLVHWQQFFEKSALSGLSEEAQRGLYGELYFLKTHLLADGNSFSRAVASWTGPSQRQHDFQFGDTAVEVKVSSAKQHQKLAISSEQQLDESLVGSLFVFHLSLSAVANQQDTLPSLVSKVREALSIDPARTSFEVSLQMAGYHDSQNWRYQATGYAIREENIFRVSGDFPRLTERNLPNGVGDLQYSISVAECRRFAVPISDLQFELRPFLT